ncbi:twin-arginine translocase TatA/TatE family subunit [Bdellovibrio bacteriovorus]|uniref:twin-arginine translocase TatA/TatE family subunit n=1 Tax=Bdellovibrio reynosensis TaxID=2835041 RepID=UPI002E81F776|nr:twin-arginine translocase TatA/TatE family subunit [Bdellovibrio reynosensis]
MNLGWTEILLIGGIALLLFGPTKLPGLGRSMGEAIRGFKKGLSDDSSNEREVNQQISQNKQQPMNQEQTQTEKDTNKQS